MENHFIRWFDLFFGTGSFWRWFADFESNSLKSLTEICRFWEKFADFQSDSLNSLAEIQNLELIRQFLHWFPKRFTDFDNSQCKPTYTMNKELNWIGHWNHVQQTLNFSLSSFLVSISTIYKSKYIIKRACYGLNSSVLQFNISLPSLFSIKRS